MKTFTLLTPNGPTLTVGTLINCENFSSLTRFLRVTPYILRAVELFKRPGDQNKGALTPELLAEAERLWLIDTQGQLRSDKNFSMWKKQFDLLTDDKGLTRCRGRLKNALIPYS